MINSRTKESGQVAIISVMFFMILFSVITVGFVRTVVSEQRQTTNNELSASALAAAESGVEDAKRIIIYCNNNPDSEDCQSIYDPTANDCNAIISNSNLTSSLKIATDQNQAVVDDNNKQYYTCMIIHYLTNDYVGKLVAGGSSVVVPLKFATYVSADSVDSTSAGYITLNWHRNSDAGNGAATGLDSSDNLPTIQAWKSAGNRPAVVRVELVSVPKSGFSLNEITNSARSVTLRPGLSSSGGVTKTVAGSTVYNLDHWAVSTEPNVSNAPILRVECNGNSNYACSVNLAQTSDFNLASYDYYLKLQSVYSDTDFQITAHDASGSTIYFNGAQPSIDVTGRAVDSYKRLMSRVETKNSWWPDYALQSGEPICKNLEVYADYGTDKCSY